MGVSDRDRRQRLAEVYELAGLSHALSKMAEDVQLLLDQATHDAVSARVPMGLVSKASGISEEQLAEQLASPRRSNLSQLQVAKLVSELTEFPQDVLREHKRSFPGSMTGKPRAGSFREGGVSAD